MNGRNGMSTPLLLEKVKARAEVVRAKEKEKENADASHRWILNGAEAGPVEGDEAKEKAEEEEKAEVKVKDGDHGAGTRVASRIDRGGRMQQTENETRRSCAITSETAWSAHGEGIASSLMTYRSSIRTDA